MSNTSFKFAKLVESLGDLTQYAFTGLIYNNETRTWNQHWKNPVFQLSDFENLPQVLSHCPCSTKIKRAFLIRHIESGRLAVIGSICMNTFASLEKRCIQCHEITRSKTSRCASCRKFCVLHKMYHPDNTVHRKEAEATPEWKVRALEKVEGTPEWFRRAREENEKFERMMDKPFAQREFQFGKWKDYTPDSLIGVADEYLQWYIGNHEEYLAEMNGTLNDIKILLMRTKACFGKYKGRSFEHIKANDPSYYRWIKRTIDKPYVKYLS